MPDIEAKVREFFKEDRWKFSEPKEHILRAEVQGENTDCTLLFLCKEEQQQLIVVGCKPSVIPEQFRLKAAELLTRANYIMNLGSYVMDFSDGELRFRTSLDVEDGELSLTMIRNITATTAIMFDQMFPCLMKLIYGNGNITDLLNEWQEK